jgi:hypothetical protein
VCVNKILPVARAPVAFRKTRFAAFLRDFVVVKSPQKEKVKMPVCNGKKARLYVGLQVN